MMSFVRTSVVVSVALLCAIAVESAVNTGTGDAKYGIVLDAGSSGTRVYLFTWEGGNELGTLSEVMHKKVSPGVSHYADEPAKAAESVRNLLDHAFKHIPEDQRSEVPITLQATAGMRLLPKSESEPVLAELRKMLKTTGLVFTDRDARIVDGASEGRYLFHAVNQALGKLGTSDVVGTLDLGGASTQIAMPRPTPWHHADHHFIVTGCKDAANCAPGTPWTTRPNPTLLYTVSRLGFGMNEAYKAFLKDPEFTPGSSSPCLFPDQVDATPEVAPRTYTGEGNYDECLPLVRKFVVKREGAKLYGNPDTSTQPRLNLDAEYYVTDNFPKVVIPTLEFLDVVPKGTRVHAISPADFQSYARTMCSTSWNTVEPALADTKATRRKKVCFGLAYATSLLELYGFPADKTFNFALEINGIDMNWPLGAIIEQIHAVGITDWSAQEAEL